MISVAKCATLDDAANAANAASMEFADVRVHLRVKSNICRAFASEPCGVIGGRRLVPDEATMLREGMRLSLGGLGDPADVAEAADAAVTGAGSGAEWQLRAEVFDAVDQETMRLFGAQGRRAISRDASRAALEGLEE